MGSRERRLSPEEIEKVRENRRAYEQGTAVFKQNSNPDPNIRYHPVLGERLSRARKRTYGTVPNQTPFD